MTRPADPAALADCNRRRSGHGYRAATAVLLLALLAAACSRQEEARTAPRAGEDRSPGLASLEKPEILTDEQLQDLRRRRDNSRATPSDDPRSPAPLREAGSDHAAEDTPSVAEEECEAARLWLRDQYTYISFRKVGDQVSGSLYSNQTGEQIPLFIGTAIGRFRVASLDNDTLTFEAEGCTMVLAKSASVPTPRPSRAMDQATLLKCGATIQHFRLIAQAMEEYFERNGLYPAPENDQRQPLAYTDPQAPIAGYFPREMVQRDLYLRTYPHDPFSENQAQPFRYACIPAFGWVVVGNGPDGDVDIDPRDRLRQVRSGDTGQFFDAVLPDDAPLYDPANGAISNGDIAVWGPNGDLSLQDTQLVNTAQAPEE